MNLLIYSECRKRHLYRNVNQNAFRLSNIYIPLGVTISFLFRGINFMNKGRKGINYRVSCVNRKFPQKVSEKDVEANLTVNENIQPVENKHRRVPYHQRKKVEQKCDRLL